MTISISNEDLVFIATAIAKANGHPEPHEWANSVAYNSVNHELPPTPEPTVVVESSPEHVVE